ncbi:MAG: SDR family NAD(P)-dependent oxidoreductase [Mucilaginibacter sp.]
MNELIIITGANKGLGYQLYKTVLSSCPKSTVLSLSRKISDDQKQLIDDPKNKRFKYIFHDFNIDSYDEKIIEIDILLKKFKKIVFINNAASIKPLGVIGKLDNKTIADSINVNCIFSMYFINYLVSKQKGKELTIVHIATGASNRPIVGWAIYSSTKAMVQMFINNLILESTGNEKIKIFSIDPGVVDTDMQSEIRGNKDKGAILTTRAFKKLYKDKQLIKPEIAAYEILKKSELI